MSACTGAYSSLLNGLDIVAMTFESGTEIPYPNLAKYGVVVAVWNMIAPFPVCIKVGMAGKTCICGFAHTNGGVSPKGLSIDTAQSTYNTGSMEVAIIWFG